MSRSALVVALGDRTYRVERPFYDHPGKGLVSDVTIDPSGAIHIALRHDSLVSSGEPAMVRLDAAGELLSRWGGDLIADAHMLTAAPDGRIFIVDRDAHEIVICRDGKRIGGLGARHKPLAPFNHPTDVAFGPDGSIYVSDGYANARVHKYSPAGELLHSWGELGDGPGQFLTPHAVWATPDGRVIVVDRENDRLQVFTPDGALIAIWRGFVKPLGIWGDASGEIYVTDLAPTLTRLSPDGETLGRCRPVLNGAHGIWGDETGRLYLAEVSPSRVTRLTPFFA